MLRRVRAGGPGHARVAHKLEATVAAHGVAVAAPPRVARGAVHLVTNAVLLLAAEPVRAGHLDNGAVDANAVLRLPVRWAWGLDNLGLDALAVLEDEMNLAGLVLVGGGLLHGLLFALRADARESGGAEELRLGLDAGGAVELVARAAGEPIEDLALDARVLKALVALGTVTRGWLGLVVGHRTSVVMLVHRRLGRDATADLDAEETVTDRTGRAATEVVLLHDDNTGVLAGSTQARVVLHGADAARHRALVVTMDGRPANDFPGDTAARGSGRLALHHLASGGRDAGLTGQAVVRTAEERVDKLGEDAPVTNLAVARATRHPMLAHDFDALALLVLGEAGVAAAVDLQAPAVHVVVASGTRLAANPEDARCACPSESSGALVRGDALGATTNRTLGALGKDDGSGFLLDDCLLDGVGHLLVDVALQLPVGVRGDATIVDLLVTLDAEER
mmetsp:Transcript_65157/g.142058  ORF Transcript_65157/g.142058 Transcript_65157/m.142058 type:complete len:450 (+) Transcript_65157:966-2315(+)